MNLLWLYLTFFKIGLLTIGGGLVALPLLQQEFVEQGLISERLFIDMFAVSQSTPGPIGINMATYVGYTNHNVLGGIIATLGMISPSLIVIIFIARHMQTFKNNKYTNQIINLLRPTAIGLVGSAVAYIFYQAILKGGTSTFLELDLERTLFAIIIGIILLKWKTNPIFIILASALVGMVVF